MGWVVLVIIVVVVGWLVLKRLVVSDKEEYREVEKDEIPFHGFGAETRIEFYSKIVGVTYKNRDGSSRQNIIKRCSVGELLELIREPKNEHDPNALKICRQNGEQLGYIGAEQAEELAPLMDSGKRVTATISDLTGGVGNESRGVNILISKPH